MGSDLFGSFAESACATMVIAAQGSLYSNYSAMILPLLVAASGIFVSIVTTSYAFLMEKVENEYAVEPTLRRQLIISTVLQTPVLYLVCQLALPDTFTVSGIESVTPNHVFCCLATGLWSGLLIGLITNYYTSSQYQPVRKIVEASNFGIVQLFLPQQWRSHI